MVKMRFVLVRCRGRRQKGVDIHQYAVYSAATRVFPVFIYSRGMWMLRFAWLLLVTVALSSGAAAAEQTVRLMANTSPPYADRKLPDEGLALELVDLFQRPTVAGLADLLREREPPGETGPVPTAIQPPTAEELELLGD